MEQWYEHNDGNRGCVSLGIIGELRGLGLVPKDCTMVDTMAALLDGDHPLDYPIAHLKGKAVKFVLHSSRLQNSYFEGRHCLPHKSNENI